MESLLVDKGCIERLFLINDDLTVMVYDDEDTVKYKIHHAMPLTDSFIADVDAFVKFIDDKKGFNTIFQFILNVSFENESPISFKTSYMTWFDSTDYIYK